jgi:hypothetical protein
MDRTFKAIWEGEHNNRGVRGSHFLFCKRLMTLFPISVEIYQPSVRLKTSVGEGVTKGSEGVTSRGVRKAWIVTWKQEATMRPTDEALSPGSASL